MQEGKVMRLFRIRNISVELVSILLILISASLSFGDSVGYVYDKLNRLEQVQYPDGTIIHYVYDNVGNRLEQGLGSLPVTAVTLSASPASPQAPGTPVVFAAGASGGVGPYEYRFRLYSNSAWSEVKAFSTDNTWTWDTSGVPFGSYSIRVDARSTGSPSISEAYRQVTYLLSNPPVTAVTLSTSPATPQAPGTQVVFAAGASGGVGPYEYRFRLYSNGAWSEVKAFGTDNTWTWDTSGVPFGSYSIRVDARSAGSPSISEAYRQVTYLLSQ
jgi:hypothetical protein